MCLVHTLATSIHSFCGRTLRAISVYQLQALCCAISASNADTRFYFVLGMLVVF